MANRKRRGRRSDWPQPNRKQKQQQKQKPSNKNKPAASSKPDIPLVQANNNKVTDQQINSVALYMLAVRIQLAQTGGQLLAYMKTFAADFKQASVMLLPSIFVVVPFIQLSTEIYSRYMQDSCRFTSHSKLATLLNSLLFGIITALIVPSPMKIVNPVINDKEQATKVPDHCQYCGSVHCGCVLCSPNNSKGKAYDTPLNANVRRGVERIDDAEDLFKHLWAEADNKNKHKDNDEKDSPNHFREQRKALHGNTRV